MADPNPRSTSSADACGTSWGGILRHSPAVLRGIPIISTMPLRDIVKYTDPRLRKKSIKVHRIDPPIQALIDDMIETMRAANGVGLAAPQVGILLRVIV